MLVKKLIVRYTGLCKKKILPRYQQYDCICLGYGIKKLQVMAVVEDDKVTIVGRDWCTDTGWFMQ